VRAAIGSPWAVKHAAQRLARIFAGLTDELREVGWYDDGWLDRELAQVEARFGRACDRWRSLYRAAIAQRVVQNRVIGDASRSAWDKQQAKRLRAEAESQMELLTESQQGFQSDFYSYRYFASEGFLPGYNFPRLPLSAYLPGRRRRKTDADEYLSRPRFLAISEFGPRSIIYHEGSRYIVNKVILPVEERLEEGLVTTTAKLCPRCGYLHPVIEDLSDPSCCEHCGRSLRRSQYCGSSSRCRMWPPNAATASTPTKRNACAWVTSCALRCVSTAAANGSARGLPRW